MAENTWCSADHNSVGLGIGISASSRCFPRLLAKAVPIATHADAAAAQAAKKRLADSDASAMLPPDPALLTLTMAKIFCCGLVGGVRVVRAIVTVYTCLSSVREEE
jgi:hypothetical protein